MLRRVSCGTIYGEMMLKMVLITQKSLAMATKTYEEVVEMCRLFEPSHSRPLVRAVSLGKDDVVADHLGHIDQHPRLGEEGPVRCLVGEGSGRPTAGRARDGILFVVFLPGRTAGHIADGRARVAGYVYLLSRQHPGGHYVRAYWGLVVAYLRSISTVTGDGSNINGSTGADCVVVSHEI